jgi:hypothetical protein
MWLHYVSWSISIKSHFQISNFKCTNTFKCNSNSKSGDIYTISTNDMINDQPKSKSMFESNQEKLVFVFLPLPFDYWGNSMRDIHICMLIRLTV